MCTPGLYIYRNETKIYIRHFSSQDITCFLDIRSFSSCLCTGVLKCIVMVYSTNHTFYVHMYCWDLTSFSCTLFTYMSSCGWSFYQQELLCWQNFNKSLLCTLLIRNWLFIRMHFNKQGFINTRSSEFLTETDIAALPVVHRCLFLNAEDNLDFVFIKKNIATNYRKTQNSPIEHTCPSQHHYAIGVLPYEHLFLHPW